LEILLEANAEVDKQDSNGSTPLHTAAYAGHVGVAQLLLGAHAEVDRQDLAGSTALHHAARYVADEEMVQILIQAKADVNKRDTVGRTALDLVQAGYHNPLSGIREWLGSC